MEKESIVLMSDPSLQSIFIEECGEGLVDLRDQDQIVYGQWSEIEGNIYYTKVRKTVYDKLCLAQRKLPKGLSFCLYEGWRPFFIQKILYSNMLEKNRNGFPHLSEEELFVLTSKLIAPPHLLDGNVNVTPHATGGAVDLYLVDEKKKPVDMGLSLDQWSQDVGVKLSPMHSMHVSQEAREYRYIMRDALESVGFVNYPTEYWHWSYGDRYWAFMKKEPHALYGPIQT